MLDGRAIDPERVRPLLRAEYERLVELGAFEDERVELLDGCLVTTSPQGSRHAEALARVSRVFMVALDGRATVRVQSPLGAGGQSLPEPDLAAVPLGSYADAHPEGGLLVIEVAESSLAMDRAKAAVYAAAGVREYWIVNLVDGVIEVHRDAAGERYLHRTTHGADATIAPAGFPELQVRVGDLIP